MEHRWRSITMTKRSHMTVLDDLPDWIVIEEILVRLPPKDVLRCRAVQKLWRSATSTDKFMLDNRRCQPLLPVIRQYIPEQSGFRFVVFRDNGDITFDQKLWPIIQLSKFHKLVGACDGFLILSDESDFWICNPATNKCAPLPQPQVPSSSLGGYRIYIAGFYQHHPSGEYQVLWISHGCQHGYILTVGSDKPRIISWPSVSSRLPKCSHQEAFDPRFSSQVNHHCSLNWLIGIYMETAVDIMVFDTITETFRWMRSPDQLGCRVSLLEMGNRLASCSNNDGSIEIWVMQDYEAEAWALSYRINLVAMKISPQLDFSVRRISDIALLNQRELLIWCWTPSWGHDYLLHCDIDEKLLGCYELKHGTYSVFFTNQYIQESMIPLPFCEMQEEGGVDKEPPFFIVL